MGKAAPTPPYPDPFFDRHTMDAERPQRRPSARQRPRAETAADQYLKQRERRLWWQLLWIVMSILTAGLGAMLYLRLSVLAAGLGFTTGSGF